MEAPPHLSLVRLSVICRCASRSRVAQPTSCPSRTIVVTETTLHGWLTSWICSRGDGDDVDQFNEVARIGLLRCNHAVCW